MRIALDIRSPGSRGVLTYTRTLLEHLLDQGRDNHFLLIKDPDFPAPDQPNVDTLVVPSANPLSWFYWSNRQLPRLLTARRIELYHTLKHVTAFGLGIPMLVTAHGGPLVFDHRDLQSAREQIYWRLVYRCAAASYEGILCATSAERKFFVDRLGASPGKVSVIPLAAEARFRPLADRAALEAVRAQYRLPHRYLLTVGAVEPVKNTRLLVRAFAAAVPLLREEWHLVIAGADSSPYAMSVQALVNELGISGRVIFLGRVASGLVEILNLGSAFVFPTLYENFGIALVEAMAVGLPVICSNIAELDNVVADAALRVDPRDHEAFARAILHLLSDERMRRDLGQRALERAKGFSWNRTATQTLQAYERAVRRREKPRVAAEALPSAGVGTWRAWRRPGLPTVHHPDR